jgi:hypothetical protein
MERRLNYEQQLTDNEVRPRPSDAVSVAMSSSGSFNEREPTTETTAEGSHMMEPPSYNVAAQLPTYDEYEQTKRQEEDNVHVPLEIAQISDDGESNKNMERIIGTDSMFIVGFIFSFLFNWLGLLVAFCVMHTCAGRFGALSGFGLSIVKWVLIVKSNEWAMGVAEQDSWVWWLMIAFGMLITCSGFLHYIRLKQRWSRRQYTFII